MGLSIGSRTIADVTVQYVALIKLVGAYELNISLTIRVNTSDKNTGYSLRLDGARVFVSGQNGNKQYIGFARPDRLFTAQSAEYPIKTGSDLCLTIQPRQVAALEDIRAEGDLKFEIEARVETSDRERTEQAHATWSHLVARSDWIKLLKDAGYMDVLLIEVPFPFADAPKKLTSVRRYLEEAQRHFSHAEYTSCIASCRKAVQEIGHHIYKSEMWSDEVIKKAAGNMRDMSKEERIRALLAMLRHFTNQAHHGEGEGGVSNYSRSEARMVLQMTAASISGVV